MSIVGTNSVKYANASENSLEDAAPIHVKLQKARESIEQMNEELYSIMENIQMKKSERDRKRGLLCHLRYMRWCCDYGFPITPEKSRCCWSRTFDSQAEPTIRDQDELIQNLRLGLFHKSNSLAEEKKLIRRIKEAVDKRNSLAEEEKLNRHIKSAEEIRETLVSNCKQPDKQTNHIEVYRAKIQKLKYHQQEDKKVVEDLESTCKELRSFEEDLTRLNEKRSRVHRIIHDLVKQQVQKSPPAENITQVTEIAMKV